MGIECYDGLGCSWIGWRSEGLGGGLAKFTPCGELSCFLSRYDLGHTFDWENPFGDEWAA